MQLQYLVPMSLPKVLVSFCVFNPLSRLEIENEIMSTPLNKTHGSYSFSSRTLRSAKYIIENVIYPSKLKLAKVIPVHKNNDEADPSNY